MMNPKIVPVATEVGMPYRPSLDRYMHSRIMSVVMGMRLRAEGSMSPQKA